MWLNSSRTPHGWTLASLLSSNAIYPTGGLTFCSTLTVIQCWYVR